MQSLVSLATTAALLLHITLGCGMVHHAHAATPCSSHSHAEDAGCSHDELGGATPSEQSPIKDQAPEPCDHLQCSFVLTGKTISSPGSDLDFGWLSIVDELAIATSFQRQQSCLAIELSTSAPPLRAHVLHQVFLI